MKIKFFALFVLVTSSAGILRSADKANIETEDLTPVIKSNAEWKKILTPEQYRVMREQGTERACSGAYWTNHEKGTYRCAACGLSLFHSNDKFESHTGWPSFSNMIDKTHIKTEIDTSFGMTRTAVNCARCGSHLGHVFDDGPPPTGLRYCINSVALRFEKEK